MASSSSERSRSARRSPRRGPSPAGGLEPAEEPRCLEPGKGDDGTVPGPEEEKQRRSKASGAVANRRQAGDPDTYQCPHCWRVIADNDCAKEQHWNSLHCRTKRYQYSGYGDEKTCRALAQKDIAKGTDSFHLKENPKYRGSDPPPEPRHRPSWKRSPSAQKKHRSRERARSAGRNRARGMERYIDPRDRCKTYGPYEVDAKGRITNPSGRCDDGIEIDKYGRVVTRGSNVKGTEMDRDRMSRRSSAPARPQGGKNVDQGSGRSGKNGDMDDKKDRARETDSEEYSYTYEDSPEGEEAGKNLPKKETQDRKAKPVSRDQKEKVMKSVAAPVVGSEPAARAGAVAPTQCPQAVTPSLPAGNIECRQTLYNSLLRTAMEAVKSLE